MIKHIVMWTLKDVTPHGPKAESLARMKALLESLPGKVSVLRHLEVGVDCFQAAPPCDIVLYTEFDSREDLQTYQDHPEHVAVAGFIREVVAERRLLDYEL